MKLGQNEVCTYLLCKKLSKQEKVSGNTVFWFFLIFPSVANITVSEQVKLKCFDKFWILGPNPEVLDHKKIVLNGKTQSKVKEAIFFAKKCRFLILDPKPKTKAIFQYKKIIAFRICSQIVNSLPDGRQNGFFGALLAQKWPFWQWGPPQSNIFFLIFNRVGTATGVAGDLQIWHFLAFFGLFRPFLTIFWVWLNIQKQTLLCYSGKLWIFLMWSHISTPYQTESKMAFFGHFWPEKCFFVNGAHFKRTFSFWCSIGRDGHWCGWCFANLALFGVFWPFLTNFWIWPNVQKHTLLYYSGKYWILIMRSHISDTLSDG